MAAQPPADPTALAEQVRQACVQAAVQAWDDAGLQGLCAEGRWEAAVSAMQRLTLAELVAARPQQQDNRG